jgi:multiple antibiotic resistance protein
MTAVVLLMGKASTYPEMGMVLAALAVMMAITFVSMLASDQLMRLLHRTGANVIARVSGVLLAALAMQFIFDGLSQSGLFR